MKEVIDRSIWRYKRKEARRRKRERVLIVIVALLFAALTYLQVYLAGLSQKLPFINSILFFALMNLNIILIGLLVFLVFRNVVKLFWERKDNILGSKLKTKLVVVFVGFTLIPTVLLFTVSAFYINNSFGKWFSSELTNSLQHALEVNNFYYQDLRERGFILGEKISRDISKRQLFVKNNQELLREVVHELQKEYAFDAIEIFLDLEEDGIAFYGSRLKQQEDLPPLEESFLKEGFSGRQASKIQPFAGGDLVRCVMPVYHLERQDIVAALVISSYVPPAITEKISKIDSTFHEYREIKPIKRSLRTIYITILLLMTLLILFTAVWFGFHLARELSTPIQNLVEGTQQIAQGNLDVQIDYPAPADDELAILVRSFNKMAGDLKEGNRKLAKAERAAAWREVARRVAHEIKNPLTPIKLSAQRLRRKYLSSTDPVFDECTQMIITQVDELKELVDEFSNFAKLPQVNLRPSQLSPIVKEAMAVYQEAHRRITFEIKIDRDLPLLELDRDQIKRVFINLLDNAVSAMSGEGRIVIAAAYNPALQSVILEVSDTGSGISDGIKSRVFDPNFSTKKGGTGLGLTIVRKIISDHQGYVRVIDNHPKGTKFIIDLPIHPKMIESVYFDERPHLNR